MHRGGGGTGTHEDERAVLLGAIKKPKPQCRAKENLDVFVPLRDLGNFDAAVRLRTEMHGGAPKWGE